MPMRTTTTSNRTRVYLPPYSERSGWSIALGFIAFLGASHILIRTSIYGIGNFHSEADVYIYDAEVIAKGKIFEKESFGLIRQPPLFAALLAIYRPLGVEVTDIGQYLNVVSFGLIVLVACIWLHRLVRFRLVWIGAAVTIIVSYPLVRISTQLLSETLFILMTLLALVGLGIFLDRQDTKNKSGFWMLTVFSALAILTRYTGVAVVITGLLLILTQRGTPTTNKWKYATIYTVISSLSAALPIIRYWIVYGTPMASRHCVPEESFWDLLTKSGNLLYLWTVVQNDLGWLDICLWIAVALAGFEVAKSLFTTKSTLASARRVTLYQKISTSLNTREQPVLPFATFALVYVVVLFTVAPLTVCPLPSEPRFLLPIYVPAVMTAAVWLERFLLKTYRTSGISVSESPDSWNMVYLKASGSVATIRWIIMGLIFTIILANIIRNIYIYVDVLITYDPYRYYF